MRADRSKAHPEPCTLEELETYIERCKDGVKREGKESWFAYWLPDLRARARRLRADERTTPQGAA